MFNSAVSHGALIGVISVADNNEAHESTQRETSKKLRSFTCVKALHVC